MKIPSDRLKIAADPAAFDFESTADLPSAHGLIGQSRALDALEFGVSIAAKGYNIYALGAQGSGRHNAVRRFVESRARELPAPDDWVYVHNFDEAYRPLALRLPPGTGPAFETDLNELIDNLKSGFRAVFESDEYRERREAIDSEFQHSQNAQFQEISKRALEQGLAVIPRPNGMAVVPVRDGKPIPNEELEKLSEADQEALQAKIQELMQEIRSVVDSIAGRDKARQQAIVSLDRETAALAAEQAMTGLFDRYSGVDGVVEHLNVLREHMVENAQEFLTETDDRQSPLDQALNRYRANALIRRDAQKGAPVVYADYPDVSHLLGRIEHLPHMGALLTDFTLITPGALHRANGGFLLIDAERLLASPFAWQTFKRCLRSQMITIESPVSGAATLTAVTLEPQPIPLDVKVILFGERSSHYLLSALDPDFDELFKVAADFDDTLARDADTERSYCCLMAAIVDDEKTREISATGCSAILERSARLAGNSGKLSLKIGQIADLIREANYWADADGTQLIDKAHVDRAISEQIRRLDLMRSKSRELVLNDVVAIDTSGSRVGQINALSVLQTGKFAFGKPGRVTANVRLGAGKLVDIEREVEMGGPIHSKGVLILSGFLNARYALEVPLSLAATLVFEQSYGAIDGDSASSAELYALLSALSLVPIRQSLAVTGSVNQKGEVQAIGGVNEKIEGFFDICAERGLTGDQGVLIPASNIRHLMLADRVIEAVEGNRFTIHAVSTIDEGLEILTGDVAGARDNKGNFPAESVNGRVEARLLDFAEARRAFSGGQPE